MLSGTKARAGDLSAIREGDAAGVLDAGCGERVAVLSTCSSGTLPTRAAEAGLDFVVSHEKKRMQPTWLTCRSSWSCNRRART
jgi:hypothetical protein